MGVDSVKHDFSAFDIVPELVELDVDVLCAWVHLWDFGNLEGATVVLKDPARCLSLAAVTLVCHWLG